MRVTVDVDLCQGIGMCEMTAPEVFEVGEDGQSSVLGAVLEGRLLDSARAGVDSCPMGALLLAE
jgi:ferredoxin